MKILISLFAAVLLSGCATMNVTSDAGDANLMLRGYDPVAYFTQGRAVIGDPAIKAESAGVTYRFANDEDRKLFLANPAKYVPAYGGFCANGAPYGIMSGGEPTTWKIVDGRLFIFGGEKAKAYWELDPKGNLERGDYYWEHEMKGSSARLQSYKRWVFRVPHYKTGPELEAQLQAKGGVK